MGFEKVNIRREDFGETNSSLVMDERSFLKFFS
jgi:hypothetical protein